MLIFKLSVADNKKLLSVTNDSWMKLIIYNLSMNNKILIQKQNINIWNLMKNEECIYKLQLFFELGTIYIYYAYMGYLNVLVKHYNLFYKSHFPQLFMNF